MMRLSWTGRRARVGSRLLVILAILVLVGAACGADSAGEPSADSEEGVPSVTAAPTTATESTATEAPATTAAPVTTAVATIAPISFSLATHGADAIGPLPGSDGMLGSGCTPGIGALPDGIWFGWVVGTQATEVAFDLACLHADQPPRATNVNTYLRDVAIEQGTSVSMTDGSSVAVEDCAPGFDPVWLFVNHGMATEVAYPTMAVTLDIGSAEWSVTEVELPVTGGCCGEMFQGPPSPAEPWPATGMPADGVYDVDTVYDVAAGDLGLTIHRLVPCADNPDICVPDFLEGDLEVDYGSAIVRRVPIDDALTVRIRGIDVGVRTEVRGIEGSGIAFAALIEEMQEAYATWIEPRRLRASNTARSTRSCASSARLIRRSRAGRPTRPRPNGTHWPTGVPRA